jgi:uncharacterized Ntn-hydrolase superfamily protein
MLFAVLLVLALPSLALAADTPVVTSTFSIVALDPETGEMGIAVASRVLAVGYIVPWAEAGTGAIATQALANLVYGIDGLELMREGFTASEALDSLLRADDGRESRQVAMITPDGDVAAFTGSETLAWSGHRSGDSYSCQGNILVGEEVLIRMEEAYLATKGPLATRLLEALRAGDAAGGDSRGKQSAALYVVRADGGYQGFTDVLVDLRVDDHEEPVAELERIYNLWAPSFMLQAYLDSEKEVEQEHAFAILEQALETQEDDPYVLNAVAWYLAERGLEPERALYLALKAHELLPDDANIMDTVAQAYCSAGDYEAAVEWEEKALEIEPDNVFFREQLQKFLSAIGPM